MPERDYGVTPPGYRLPDESHIGAVRLQVADLQRSIDYYERVVGARTLLRSSDTGTLGSHGDDRVLIYLHAREGARPAPRLGTYGLYHFAILLPDRASLGRFVAHLSRIGVRAGMSDHSVSEAVYLTDPDGLGIEVYADRPRSAWRRHGRELAMTVDPLDVSSLIAAAAGTVWEGLPAGSTIGHVHLHVKELSDAERFYHSALGFEKIASLPGALFLSAGGYHHHLGTNTWSPGPAAADDQARLLEWELVIPTEEQASAAARGLSDAGYDVRAAGDSWTVSDPSGTPLRIVTSSGLRRHG